MIELIVKKYLEEKLNLPVYMENPNRTLDKYIKIEKTGGSEENHILTATIAIQSYALSMYESSLLNEQVKSVMKNIIELNDISKVKLIRDYNFTDTTKKQYRYQAIYDLVFFD